MRAIALPALLIVLGSLVGCGGSAPGAGARDGGLGQTLYERDCAMCHGMDGAAARIGRGAADLNDPAWQARTSDEQIVQVIAEGRGMMPAWKSRLSEEEIRAVAAYVRSLK